MIEKIAVTEADIREASFRRDAEDYREMCECPVAQAVRKLHPDWSVAASFIDRGLCDTIPLPREAKDFIKQFDHEQSVEPFEFEIEVEEED